MSASPRKDEVVITRDGDGALTDQLRLFAPDPAPDPYGQARRLQPAPRNGSPTSREAAEQIEPVAPSMRYRVLGALRRRPMTNEEIARTLDMRLQTVCGRVAELRSQGLLEDSGDRRQTTAGRQAIVWRATTNRPTG